MPLTSIIALPVNAAVVSADASLDGPVLSPVPAALPQSPPLPSPNPLPQPKIPPPHPLHPLRAVVLLPEGRPVHVERAVPQHADDRRPLKQQEVPVPDGPRPLELAAPAEALLEAEALLRGQVVEGGRPDGVRGEAVVREVEGLGRRRRRAGVSQESIASSCAWSGRKESWVGTAERSVCWTMSNWARQYTLRKNIQCL